MVLDAIGAFRLMPSTNVIQLTLTLKMTTAQSLSTTVLFRDYVHPNDHAPPIYEMTAGFKPFTVFCSVITCWRQLLEKVDSAIHWINHYTLNSANGFPNTYAMDSDLSDR